MKMKISLPIPTLVSMLALRLDAGFAGIPEPGFMIFGQVLGPPPSAPTSLSLSWTNRLGGELVVVPARWVVVNGTVFHFAHIPFETRQVAGGPRFEVAPNTFEMPSAPVAFTRIASLDGRPLEFVNPGQAIFTFGPADRGRVERVDLRVTNPLPDVDTDGDGMPDAAEVLAGTDPHDPASVLKAYSDLKPELLGGEFDGIAIEWQSVPGRRYVVERADALGKGFTAAGPVVTAETAQTRFSDASATGAGPFFYRIRVD